jgi:glycogen debranching enzyme GlgX/4-alpha-glucanotransferase
MQITSGLPTPLGVHIVGDGINVAVFAPDAEAIAICLFDAADHETARITLPGRTGPVFHGRLSPVAPGARYGLRAFGPYDPGAGHRFNPNKLLLDPWATTIDRPFRLHELLFDRDGPRPDDTAALMPKAIVTAPPAGAVNAPQLDWNRQVIYELHVRGFTKTHPEIPESIRGTYAGLAHPAAVSHLKRLGITTVEIMPSAAWVDERHLPPLGLTNYWGYNPVGFLAPDPRLAPGGWPEVRAAVDALHAAGMSVILDVVLNHSGESDELGPTLSMRGLGNAAYYRLAADNRALYVNDAGCGNVLAMDQPGPLRLSMDALRTWAVYGGFDGFRLDLAATLGRRREGFDPQAPFLDAVEQDPVLSRSVMIAEPWDIGPGGYQLGAFPARWGEWNDRYRDDVRRFWRGDDYTLGGFATRFAGSADVFAGHRPLTRSINYITAHDGFALRDLVSYGTKHNQANGEDNRDGSNSNNSWNNGAEGASDEPAVQAGRQRDVRALLATLLLSRGSPMLSMGDELGRSQAGNNNAYAQDNASSWIDWASADKALTAYTTELIDVRRSLTEIFDDRTLTGQPVDDDRLADVTWHQPGGDAMRPEDWNAAGAHTLIAVLTRGPVRVALVFHAGHEPLALTLPPPQPGRRWDVMPPTGIQSDSTTIEPRSVTVIHEVVVDAESRDDGWRTNRTQGISDSALDELSRRAGIDSVWWEVNGRQHVVSPETKRALLTAMRLPATTQGDHADTIARLDRDARRPLPPVFSGRVDALLTIPLGQPTPRWVTLVREDGSTSRFASAGRTVSLPPQPAGRHTVLVEDQPEQLCHLIVAPGGCYIPPALAGGGRRFGIAAHLYTLRSAGDQGIGDFTSLGRLAINAARDGAAMIGLNPLHAMFPHDRSRVSPYQPSDRRFLDPIYIDVSALRGGAASASPSSPVDDAVVDYASVWAAKRAVLKTVVEPTDDIPDGLRRFATFEAIADALGTSQWRTWPAELRHPDDPAVARFAEAHRGDVSFHAFVQTLADSQLAQAARQAKDSGMSIGFYRDLAVGAAPDGAEAWSAQDTMMTGVSIGAPPDPIAEQGQIWSLPPPDPVAMRHDGYATFDGLLTANMRHAGALRIDHVMGLRRLFLVPEGADGTYVAYPLNDLLALTALRSQQAQCLVVGEDLGTVPEGLGEALAANNVLSYSVLWFQRQGDVLSPPSAWRQLAAACVSTHDLPTLVGWWDGADIAEKHRLGLIDDVVATTARRRADKLELVSALRQQGLLSEPVDPDAAMPIAVGAAVHAYVAATPALLALVQADDLAAETVAVNLPGTDRERPNWQRRLHVDVDQLLQSPLARAIIVAMQGRRDAG